MSEMIYTVSENMLKNLCNPETGYCCPFLAHVQGKVLCARNTSLEKSHCQNRARKNLPTRMGFCTGVPLFLRSTEEFDPESFNMIVFTISIDENITNLHLTYYTYSYFSFQAEKYNMPLQDYLREVVLASIEKKNDS